MQLVQTGDIFDQSKIIRIDRGLGLLLEIPSSPVATPAYVSVSLLDIMRFIISCISTAMNEVRF